MEETIVVDRIEGDIAVCENRANGVIINIQISKLPENIREGSILKYYDGKYRLDSDEQKNIEDRIKDKMDSLWE